MVNVAQPLNIRMSNDPRHEIAGKIACSGIATGKPVIVLHAEDLDSVMLGDILVAVETDISFVPAMQKAAAIITETGGRFCHAAIWARENRKPTLLQVKDATTRLKTVSMVTVDANDGKVIFKDPAQ